mmetsp:Transcript_86866/g.278695  ORF Transcript_86866/g.278695 Transcript_86866/m.278695 type:complete len:241 (-) Transcript_86866:1058-1780(-)
MHATRCARSHTCIRIYSPTRPNAKISVSVTPLTYAHHATPIASSTLLDEQGSSLELPRMRLPENRSSNETARELPCRESQAIRQRCVRRRLGTVVREAGSCDTQADRWVQLTARDGANCEASGRHARADGEPEVVVLLRLPSRRRRDGRAREHRVHEHEGEKQLHESSSGRAVPDARPQLERRVPHRPSRVEGGDRQAGHNPGEQLRGNKGNAITNATSGAQNHGQRHGRVELSSRDIAE